MNKKTVKALNSAVAKWTAIVDSTGGVDEGWRNCPLCILFFKIDCKGCPVRGVTTDTDCIGTPFETWINHHSTRHRGKQFPIGMETYASRRRVRGCSTCMRLAMSERDFLKGLLPKKEER